MSVRNVAGILLIAFGMLLIWSRARQKGDVSLLADEKGGIWPVIGQLGDAVYILGAICIVIGAFLIDPTIIDLVQGEGSEEESS